MDPSRLREFFTALRGALLPLLTPVIIIVVMTSGFYTPTEAAALAAIYTFLLGFFIHREIKGLDLWQSLLSTVKITSNIMIIVGFAGVFGWILISEQVSNLLIEGMESFTNSPVVLLLLINVILLIMGCFLSTTSLIVIFSPHFPSGPKIWDRSDPFWCGHDAESGDRPIDPSSRNHFLCRDGHYKNSYRSVF
jgi:C4-dicarboxylate transporter DctM subunit